MAQKSGTPSYSALFGAKTEEEEEKRFLCYYSEKCVLSSSQYRVVPFPHGMCKSRGGKEPVGELARSI